MTNEEEQQDNRNAEISKELAQTLRHDPPDGKMDGCGFVPVSKIAQHLTTTSNPSEIITVAQNDDKGRYQLGDSNEEDLRIRATQGHSIKLKTPLLDPIEGPHEVPLALHATSEEAWEQIQKSGELRRMNRTHIHFAAKPAHLRANDWACVLLKVDLGAAISDGIEFCRAVNGVVLCEGPIPLKYIERVELNDLPESWQKEIPNKERLLGNGDGIECGD